MNEQQPIIVGLDIGTTKIAAIAGRKNEFGKLEVLGFGRANSNGVKHGQVLNIDETIKAITMALENCYASNPGLEINEVYAGIAAIGFCFSRNGYRRSGSRCGHSRYWWRYYRPGCFLRRHFKTHGRYSFWWREYYQRHQNRFGCFKNTGRTNESSVRKCAGQ